MERRIVRLWMMVAVWGVFPFLSAIAAEPNSSTGGSLGVSTTRPRPEWARVFSRLASEDFAERAKAQRKLASALPQDLEVLESALDKGTDPEVRAALSKRVNELQELAAVDPPPITVHFKNAFSEDVAAELKRAMRFPVRVLDKGESPLRQQTPVTLDAVDRPFWEVMQEICRQTPIGFQDANELELLISRPVRRTFSIFGPLIVLSPQVERSNIVRMGDTPGAEERVERFLFSCDLQVDPRFYILSERGIAFTQITDDLGEVLHSENLPEDNSGGWQIYQENESRSQSGRWVAFKAPGKEAKSLSSIQGQWQILVRQKTAHATLNNVASYVGGSEVVLLDQAVRIDTWTQKDGFLLIGLDFNSTKLPAWHDMKFDSMLRVSVVSANGDVVYSSDVQSFLRKSIFTGGGGPYHLELTEAITAKILTLPFELKNVPLP